jgi:hypothetical protein
MAHALRRPPSGCAWPPIKRSAPSSRKTERPLATRTIAKGRMGTPSECWTFLTPCLAPAGGSRTIRRTIPPPAHPGQANSGACPAGIRGRVHVRIRSFHLRLGSAIPVARQDHASPDRHEPFEPFMSHFRFSLHPPIRGSLCGLIDGALARFPAMGTYLICLINGSILSCQEVATPSLLSHTLEHAFRKKFIEVTGSGISGGTREASLSAAWSAHQRFLVHYIPGPIRGWHQKSGVWGDPCPR